MPDTETLPDFDNCIDLYVQIHDLFGTDVFDTDDLSRRLETRDTGSELPTDLRPMTRLLDLLSAYGLLDRLRDGRYRVRCEPDESLDRWRAKTATRVESIYERVHQTMGPYRDEPTVGSGREELWNDGDAFVSIRLTDSTDLQSAQTFVQAAMKDRSECAGIVLCSPGELAAKVQRFADRLCEPAATASGEPAFEKVTTDLVGDDKDDLEFRLFLREST